MGKAVLLFVAATTVALFLATTISFSGTGEKNQPIPRRRLVNVPVTWTNFAKCKQPSVHSSRVSMCAFCRNNKCDECMQYVQENQVGELYYTSGNICRDCVYWSNYEAEHRDEF